MLRAILALMFYLLIVAFVRWMNKREFTRSPEKGARYAALPKRYKLACYLGVIPLIVVPGFLTDSGAGWLFGVGWLLGMVAFAVLESACFNWYKKNGLL
jgi:hypothetical protein